MNVFSNWSTVARDCIPAAKSKSVSGREAKECPAECVRRERGDLVREAVVVVVVVVLEFKGNS